jgi:hypothetical protein
LYVKVNAVGLFDHPGPSKAPASEHQTDEFNLEPLGGATGARQVIIPSSKRMATHSGPPPSNVYPI